MKRNYGITKEGMKRLSEIFYDQDLDPSFEKNLGWASVDWEDPNNTYDPRFKKEFNEKIADALERKDLYAVKRLLNFTDYAVELDDIALGWLIELFHPNFGYKTQALKLVDLLIQKGQSVSSIYTAMEKHKKERPFELEGELLGYDELEDLLDYYGNLF